MIDYMYIHIENALYKCITITIINRKLFEKFKQHNNQLCFNY